MPTTSQASAAASGFGFTATTVNVGIALETDAATIGSVFGYSGFNYGDQKSIFNAGIAAANKRGGLLGRKIVPIYYDVSSLADVSKETEKACTTWTQDNKVAVVLDGIDKLANPQMWDCLKRYKVPVIGGVGIPLMKSLIMKYWPLVELASPTTDRISGPWFDTLKSLGYFTPWDTILGQPGKAAVKIGLLHSGDDPDHNTSWAYFKRQLVQRGYTIAADLTYTGTQFSNLSGIVLKMKSAGVTHVIFDANASLAFPSNAENQKYRPRYGVSTFTNIGPFMVTQAPRAQLNGMLGIGWSRVSDVNPQQAGFGATRQQCLNEMKANGADVSTQNSQLLATGVCDLMRVLPQAASKAGSLISPNLIYGLRAVSATVPWDTNFGLRAVANDPSLIGWVRALGWDNGCECVQYSGPKIAI